ncbi:hypothetical protein [Reyranella sp.]|uniref:hypothetical protein n=1 Tax=Reyranella sp. TaxID=1929291 RepID=UPI003782E7E7
MIKLNRLFQLSQSLEDYRPQFFQLGDLTGTIGNFLSQLIQQRGDFRLRSILLRPPRARFQDAATSLAPVAYSIARDVIMIRRRRLWAIPSACWMP